MANKTLIYGAEPSGRLNSIYNEFGVPKVKLLGRADFSNGSINQPSIIPGYTWGADPDGSMVIENSALRMNYPALVGDPLWQGGIYNYLNFNLPNGHSELYIKFDAKMPNAKHGLKFCKVFGRNATGGSNTVANTTFGLDYTGIDNGSMRTIGFGDGATQSNDTQQVLFLNGGNPSWVGRSYGAGAVITANSTPQIFDSADWGTSWHTFRFKLKFNTGTTAENEINDGEILINIDGVDYVHATGLFNRHYTNGYIDYISFGNWTQAPSAGSPAFDIHYDNIMISTNGFYEGA